MGRESKTSPDPDELALDWFARTQRGLTDTEKRAFSDWLNASPMHNAAFRRAASLWAASEAPGMRVAEEEDSVLRLYLEKMDRSTQRRKSLKLSLTTFVLCTGVLGSLWLTHPVFLDDLRADYVSRPGERRNVTLPDGSMVLLDADSALAQHFSTGERRVELLRGNAYFSIEKTGTPFIVETVKGTIEVLGTRFDVRLTQEEATVTVAQGVVSVSPQGTINLASTLRVGQQISFSPAALGEIKTVDVQNAMTWHEGRFTFYEMRFSDVIAEVQRYRGDRLIIMNKDLANRRVTGSFSLDESETALTSLQSTIDFDIHSIAGRWTILR